MIKTAEYVRRGHPDRLCDITADAILDEYLKGDPFSRVAVEILAGHGVMHIIGEVTSNASVDVVAVAKQVYREIGYTDELEVVPKLSIQSPEIKGLADTGAGDSGIVVGYATNETPEKLPLEVVLAKKIADKLDKLPYLLPDGKVQVTVDHGQATKIVIAYQAESNYDEQIKEEVTEIMWDQITIDAEWTMIQFKVGGFFADTGLTGRKNVLWYGPQVPTGGGAFAGKDATKVDRSGAYLARNIAIKFLKDGKPGMEECLVKLAYVIGKPLPEIATVNGTNIESLTNMSVKDTIEVLGLRNPIYKKASMAGHFGNPELPWEM